VTNGLDSSHPKHHLGSQSRPYKILTWSNAANAVSVKL
jgi:hypothetical protein